MFFGATSFSATTFAGVGIQNVVVLVNGKRVNIAIGNSALYKLVDAGGVAEAGDNNIAVGRYALGDQFISGTRNISLGQYSGYQFTSGSHNILMGYQVMRSGSGDNNIAMGTNAAFSMGSVGASTVPTGNIIMGSGAFYNSDDNNTFNFEGLMQETIIYTGDQLSTRTGIETQMNNYYNMF